MAKKNTQEHKDWLVQLIQDDLQKWADNIEEAKADPEINESDYFQAEIAIANRCLRWLSNGVKPSEVEKTYRNVIKTLRSTKEILEHLKDISSQS